MADLYEVEVEPEIRFWLESLTDRDFGRVDFLVGLLAVFRKTRSAKTAEVERAVRAQGTCEATHGVAHDIYEREGR